MSIAELGHETRERLQENTKLKWLAFLVVFFSFTQYDIELSGGRINYLLTTAPLLLGLVSMAHVEAYGKIQLSRKLAIFFLLPVLLFPWATFPFEDLPLFNFIMFNAVLLIAVLFATLALTHTKYVVDALGAFIWFSIVSIMFQVLFNAVTGVQLDMHNAIFPMSRESEIGANHGFGFLRFNGFHLEPGSYAANVGVAMAVYIGIKRQVPHVMVLCLLLTLLITRSASALMYFGVLALVFYVETLKRNALQTLVMTPFTMVLLLAFVYFSGFLEYIENRFIEQSFERVVDMDGSTRVKLMNFSHLMTSGPERQVLGSGFMRIDCAQCGFVNSNGAAFALVFFFGVAGVAIIIWLLLSGVRRSLVALSLVIMLLLSRHTFAQPNFWVPIVMLFAFPKFGQMRRL